MQNLGQNPKKNPFMPTVTSLKIDDSNFWTPELLKNLMILNSKFREINDQGIDLQKVYNKARNEKYQAH